MDTTILPFFAVYDPQRPGLAPTEAAYLAGLLDGEGYFGLRRSSTVNRDRHLLSYAPTVTLVMCEQAFLEELAGRMPFKTAVERNNRVLKGRARPSWRISWTGNACTAVCRIVHPYTRLKRGQIALLLELTAEKRKARAAGMLRGVAYPPYIKELEARIYEKLRALNLRGQDNP